MTRHRLGGIWVALLLSSTLGAQETMDLALKGGKIVDSKGVFSPGVILIRDGLIAAVGPDVEIPGGCRVLDVTGKVVFPGFIDAGNAGLLDPVSWARGPASATDRTSDALVAFNPETRRRYLREGIGAVYVEMLPGAKNAGPTGCLVSLTPDAPLPPVLDEACGVTFRISGAREGESNVKLRLTAVQAIQTALKGAKSYQEAWEKHRTALAEYETKLAAWKKAGSKPSKPSEGASSESSKKPAVPSGTGLRLPPEFRTWSREKRRAYVQEQARLAREGKNATAETKEGPPKRPTEPEREPSKEALVRVLERKTSLRVEAEWKQDILAALETAKEYGVSLVILGGGESFRVIDELKAARAIVALRPPREIGAPRLEGGIERPALARELQGQGVRFAFMTAGSVGFRSDSLRLIACLHVAEGLDEEAALVALTKTAAEAVGQEGNLGCLNKGARAHLQILSGDPLAPDTRVTHMILGNVVIEP